MSQAFCKRAGVQTAASTIIFLRVCIVNYGREDPALPALD
jgi:hypothetical protein